MWIGSNMQCATAAARANSSSSNGSYASEAFGDTQIVTLRENNRHNVE